MKFSPLRQPEALKQVWSSWSSHPTLHSLHCDIEIWQVRQLAEHS